MAQQKEETKATQEKIDKKLEAAFKAACKEARELLVAADRSDVLARYKVGVIILRVKERRGYGERGVERMEEELGRDQGTLYRYATVVETWEEPDFKALMKRTNAKGLPLTWSHYELLATVKDGRKLNGLITRALKECLSVHALRAIIDAAKQESKQAVAGEVTEHLPLCGHPPPGPGAGRLREGGAQLGRAGAARPHHVRREAEEEGRRQAERDPEARERHQDHPRQVVRRDREGAGATPGAGPDAHPRGWLGRPGSRSGPDSPDVETIALLGDGGGPARSLVSASASAPGTHQENEADPMGTNEERISSAKKLHGILSDLWPMLSMKNVGIVVDSADWRPDSVAFYLGQTNDTEGYVSR